MEIPLVNQVTPIENLDDHSTLPSSNTWACEQNNATNAYYVTLSSGQVNNNNKNNSYAVVPVAESCRLIDALFEAEEDCWKSKKSRQDAARFHFHLAEVFDLFKILNNRSYQPTTSTCFVLTYPRYREVFAAKYRDRVVHHLVAPFVSKVTEAVHITNGDISHGNRNGFSAQTAAEQIQLNMRRYPNGVVATMDVQGFFMNINREVAYQIFVNAFNKYKPSGYSEQDTEFMLWVLYQLIHHYPASDCVRNSPLCMWDKIPPEKTLFCNKGKGLPIGNFYSQLIANLVLSVWGRAVLDMGLECRVTQFVDDMCIVAKDKHAIHKIRQMSIELLEDMKLNIHPKKFYIQPTRHGVQFCGRVIYANRMYINNRTIRACKNSIKQATKAGASLRNAEKLLNSFNSYMGFMCHTRSYKIQCELASMVEQSDYKEYLYFKHKKGQVVCVMYEKYKPLPRHIEEIKELKTYYKQEVYGNDELLSNGRANWRTKKSYREQWSGCSLWIRRLRHWI